MERCSFWKNKNKNLLCWQGLVLLDWSWQVRTCPKHDVWSNLTRFGFKIRFLTKFHNDSASFLLEKLKTPIILIKNLNIWLKISKIMYFSASPTKMMQNHYAISSKYHFGTWNVPNWTKSLKSDMSGPAKTCFTK